MDFQEFGWLKAWCKPPIQVGFGTWWLAARPDAHRMALHSGPGMVLPADLGVIPSGLICARAVCAPVVV